MYFEKYPYQKADVLIEYAKSVSKLKQTQKAEKIYLKVFIFKFKKLRNYSFVS